MAADATWTVPGDADVRAVLADRIEAQSREVGIVVGVIDAGGRRVVSHGETRVGDGRRPDGETVFEIGSITKVMAGLLLTDMAERGEVGLDDPVAKHLPAEVRMPTRGGQAITLADLATHTSGLPRLPSNLSPADPANPYADYTVDQLYQFLGGHELAHDVGHVEYSNLGFGLLGHALALRGGASFEALVAERITGPLGMSSTGPPSPALGARLATGHDPTRQPDRNWDFLALAGAGCLWSTAEDLMTFSAAELGFTPTPLKAAMAAQVVVRRARAQPDTESALGWAVTQRQAREIVWKDGGTGGYRTFLGLDFAARVGVVVLANTAGATGVDDLGFHLLTGAPLAAAAVLSTGSAPA